MAIVYRQPMSVATLQEDPKLLVARNSGVVMFFICCSWQCTGNMFMLSLVQATVLVATSQRRSKIKSCLPSPLLRCGQWPKSLLLLVNVLPCTSRLCLIYCIVLSRVAWQPGQAGSQVPWGSNVLVSTFIKVIKLNIVSSVSDPDSGVFWIRIRDQDPGA